MLESIIQSLYEFQGDFQTESFFFCVLQTSLGIPSLSCAMENTK